MFEKEYYFDDFVKAQIKVVCIGGDARTVNKFSTAPQIDFIAVDDDENIADLRADIEKFFKGADLIFIVAGAKTSAAPAIAEIAKSFDALTVAVVILPFDVGTLRPHVDTIITIPNDNNVDEIIFKTVQGIFSLLTTPYIITLELQDVNVILKNAGEAYVGIGAAKTSMDAAKTALEFPLLKNKIQGAYSLLLNFTGAENSFSMLEVNEAATIIQEAANPDAEIMWGMSIDESLGDTVRVTIIATRFTDEDVKVIEQDNESLLKLPPWMR